MTSVVVHWRRKVSALVVVVVLLMIAAWAGPALADGMVGGSAAETRPAVQNAVGGHWAWASAKALVEAGIGGDELSQGALSVKEALLDQPITPLEWNRWVAAAVGREPGPGTDGDERYWLYVYTGGEEGGNRSVVSRGYAVAGLAKVGNMYGFVPGSRGPLEYLTRFPDWRWLDEKGYAGPCEAMVAAGVVSGYPDGTLRPEQPLTLGEAAALLKGWLELAGWNGKL